MSDIAIGRQKAANPFQAGAIAIMLILGIGSFLGVILLGAYAPDMRSGRNGGGHALSNSATGFSAIVQLARATGRNPQIVRSEHEFGTENLLVVTPESGRADLTNILSQRFAKPTLVVLPKWRTQESKKHSGWVDWISLQPLYEPQNVLVPSINLTMAQYRSHGEPLRIHGLPEGVRFRAPRPIQVITGLSKVEPLVPKASAADAPAPPVVSRDDLDDEAWDEMEEGVEPPVPATIKPLITDSRGGIVLAQVDDQPFFILADPDLLSNRGMGDVNQAASAMALLDWLNSNPPESVSFDVSLNGFGHSRSPLKLLFEPPFLAMTICVAVALLLAGVQAFGRFGPARARERAIAFGKAALVDNSAALVRKAGREDRMGGRYAAVIRERAVAIFAISSRLRDGALDAYLDKLKGKHRFTELAAAAEAAESREELLAAAQALHNWQKEKMG